VNNHDFQKTAIMLIYCTLRIIYDVISEKKLTECAWKPLHSIKDCIKFWYHNEKCVLYNFF
jgi:hypothetical protein